MVVLLQDCTGRPRMLLNCTATLSLSLCSPTPMTTTTTAAAPAAAAAAFLKYHHSLISLSHSMRLRPLLLHTHATRSSFLFQPTKRKFPSSQGNFFPSHPHRWQHCFFSNLPPEGRKSHDQGSGGGNFILEKIFTSPGTNLSIYY